MQDIVIEFEDAIALVKSLPLLSDLGIGVVVPSLQLWYIPSNELTEHVLSTYSCASIRLKYLLIYRSLVDDIGKICIKYILLMALACPHLTFVAPYSGSYGKFFKLMRKTIYSTTFKKYAPQLERLLTNDYYNGK
ncbi:hypothetical protein GGI04_002127 [Coemansia thaxteri]|nr:hypothetical protein GGI04_002127 [Coemansia thaxteri]KAJ2468776.1 hypothetical protein GGI02_003604 [Coemansia sp. RSA 2322]